MSDIENLSAAFKHINLYEILEPQKLHNVQVGTLVDISDDKAVPNEELIGSFIDKVTKPKFDILDVYENIYVTPQHLEPQDKNELDLDIFIKDSCDEVDSASSAACGNVHAEGNNACDMKSSNNNASEILFPKLLRFEEKPIHKDTIDDLFKLKGDLNQDVTKKSIPISLLDPIHNIMGTDKAKNIPFVVDDLKKDNLMCSTDISKNKSNFLFTPEAIIGQNHINEELFKPNLKLSEERFDLSNASDVPLQSCQNIQEMTNETVAQCTFLQKSVPQDKHLQNWITYNEINNDPRKILSVLPDEVSEQISHTKLNLKKNTQKLSTNDNDRTHLPNVPDLHNLYKQKDNLCVPINTKLCLKTVKPPQDTVNKQNFLLKNYLALIKCSIINENKLVQALTHPPIPVLNTVRLDKKVLAKRCVKTVCASNTHKYTKGPDVYEKSLILPQIMARLMIRNKCVEAKRNVRRKFILDCQSGGDERFEMPTLVTEVIIADCNRERLKALKVRQAFDEFIKYGHV